ncbi:metallophosphoesterase family protein [Stygiolobus caldivivus]|uniref:Phosphoesterase n=1 Tax=Stygiolobus caldivivus TaxID=2824673 RepID=A0A8D5ZKS7_9CREN|nr:metallophosphoesterase [Stygiolobus caldivivus]BCU71582.1 phosphoesterase [Stygiolobus caldivivus]
MPLETKILFVSDIHGSEIVLRKALNASKMFSVNYLILGGDLFSKDFLLIRKAGNNYYAGEREVSLSELYEEYKISGIAPLFFERIEEINEFKSNSHFRKEKILEFIEGQAAEWSKIFNEKKQPNIKVLWNTGNDDPLEVDSIMQRYGLDVSENKIEQLDDLLLLTCGYVNPTPWNTYRELPESTLYNKILDKLKGIEHFDNVIFNFHAPPYNTKLDFAVIDKGKRDHVGSTSVREVIEKLQPLLGLHGHVHESAGVDKIGSTNVVNPGSDYKEGILNYALIAIRREMKGFGKFYVKKYDVKAIHLGKG